MLPFAYLKTVFVKMTLGYRGVIRVSEVFIYLLIGLPMLMVLQVMDLVAYLQWSSDTADPEKRKSKRYIISYEHFDMFYNLLFETAQACQRENKTIKAMEFIKKVQTMMDTDENIFTMIYGTKPGN